jgi:large subunit ribosomal protein L30
MTKIKVTLKKSTIGATKDVKDTVQSLGLRKLNACAVHEDTPSIRGMVHKVRHLVKVEDVEAQA